MSKRQPYSAGSDARAFYRECVDLGWTCKTGGAHYRWNHPLVPHPVFQSCSPTTRGRFDKVRNEMRRALERALSQRIVTPQPNPRMQMR